MYLILFSTGLEVKFPDSRVVSQGALLLWKVSLWVWDHLSFNDRVAFSFFLSALDFGPCLLGLYNIEEARVSLSYSWCNKWRGVTVSLRTGGQGHPTTSLTPTTTPTTLQHTDRQYQLQLHMYVFFAFSTRVWQLKRNGRTDGPTDRSTKLLWELRVRN